MESRKEVTELWLEIKKDIYRVEEKGLYNYTKFAIYNLFNSIAKDGKVNVKCSEELLKELREHRSKYRMTSDIDEISVQYIKLYDYIKKDDSKYIKIYASIYFYDNLTNNLSHDSSKTKDRYLNDIWILTFKCDSNIIKKEDEIKCSNCGSTMNYNKFINVYECQYCKNSIKYDGAEEELELIDIEVKK